MSDRDHVRGPKNAPVMLVEYGDYECPYCGRAHPIVKQLEGVVGDLMRFVYRHFPLADIHPHSVMAAAAAEAAGAHGRFWPMHDLLFENQDRLDEPDLVHYAVLCGLHADQFRQDLATEKYYSRVREDVLGGLRSQVRGTPTFFINGYRHEGSYEFPVLLAAVAAAADRARHPTGPGNLWNQISPPQISG